MQVATPNKTHPLQNIAESGAAPMQKTVALRTGNPDKITGIVWAQNAIALCMGTASQWSALAQQLLTMNTEQRAAALNQWKAWKGSKTKAFKAGEEQSPKMDEKQFKRIMATATVRLSHMSTISKAMDAGMTPAVIANHYGITEANITGLSIDSLYQLAKTYSQSKAGRKEKTFKEALVALCEKFEESVADEEANLLAKIVALL